MSTAMQTFMPKSGRRWTIGQVSTDLAIVLVAVPLGLELIAPVLAGGCGMTAEFAAFTLGVLILEARPAWLILKALNAICERWLDSLADQGSRPKPQPLEDF